LVRDWCPWQDLAAARDGADPSDNPLEIVPTFHGERHDAALGSITGIRAGALGDVGACARVL
jgi:hypothetical protein